ncbi:hypothetical protein [Vibrio phage VEN]|uniref:Uncharacterized protein n=1 Tax=Vibrio phage VEN TaxID=2059879 RepID=A0A2H5BMY1_9CAUD|nr:hypothetical protein HOS56_gp10 [Vibrio phage VEN]AUG87677.1 hypothetical protein [Vibrio phage VEN]
MANITEDQVKSLVSQCSYKDGWEIITGGHLEDGSMFIQLSVSSEAGRCSVTKQPTAWKSGKRYLSKWMCSQEIVGCVFSLIKAAEEHEMLEWFRYQGASIFNPHLNPDVLVQVAKKKDNFVTRPDNQSMTQEEV